MSAQGFFNLAIDARRLVVLFFILIITICVVYQFNAHSQSTSLQAPLSPAHTPSSGATDDSTLPQHVFSNIYATRAWGTHGGGSGDGSSLEYTKRTRALVEMIVYKYNIDLFVDAPCGAMTWMPSVLERIHKSRPSFRYLGVDVVPNVVENNIKTLQRDYISFRQHDFSTGAITDLPKSEVSVIFCRDALQHLSYDTLIAALESFAKTSVEYLIIGSYYEHGTLSEIQTGGYFPFDISKVIDFPKPIEVISEETQDFKHLIIYERKSLQDFPLKEKMLQSLKRIQQKT